MPRLVFIRLAATTLLAAAVALGGVAAQSRELKKAAEPNSAAVDGVWDATIQLKDAVVPFRLRLSGDAAHVQATYFDGERPVRASSGGSFKDGQLHVDFASYAAKLDAQLDADGLQGTIGALPFEAHRHVEKAAVKGAPAIGGVWEVPVETNKGEKAWRLIVDQKPAGVYATILRIDGDTGTISGRYDGQAFALSRFAGERPTALKITPQPDGSLALVLTDQQGPRELKAIRPAEARKAGLAAPADPTRHTSVQDTADVFRFSGKDLSGKAVSNLDPRFKGKVVLLNIMGSWCPNCHDEAPFLAELDAKYRAKGLRIVGLDFEGGQEQIDDPSRLKAFIARYGLKYTILIGGVRSQVNEKLPQAVNLNAWPTTFFIGRDGTVHATHVGFPSRGSGQYDKQARADISREIETLLAEKG
ncbi:MAG: TlpA family protein disulfide reductase [Caulobacteraceae bacterium]